MRGDNAKPTERASRVDKFVDDPRNWLFKWFVEIAAVMKPRVVLIENVPDLVRHRDGETRREILKALAEAGDQIATVRVLNAADYGVPQMRRRAFFLAQRIDDLDGTGIRLGFPAATHRPFPLPVDERADPSDSLEATPATGPRSMKPSLTSRQPGRVMTLTTLGRTIPIRRSRTSGVSCEMPMAWLLTAILLAR